MWPHEGCEREVIVATESLKLGTAQYGYLWGYSLEHALREIRRLGFRYVELMTTTPHVWPPDLSPAHRRDLRNMLEGLGLELSAVNPTFLDINLASPNPGIRAESIRQIKEQITLAHDLGAPLVVVIPGRRHPLSAPPVETVWEDFAREAVFECVEHAEKNKVVFGLENAPSLFIDSAERMNFVINEVNSAWMKIVFDVANAAMIEPVVQGLELVKDHVIHVHLSDTDRTRWSHAPVGEGGVDFAPIALALKEMEFSGVSILEVIDSNDPEGGIKSSFERLNPLGWNV